MDRVSPIDAFKLVTLPTERAGDRVETSARTRFGVAQALAQGRIAFHYQPVVRAHEPSLRRILPCLARMRQPNGEVRAAGSFLPLVEAGPIGRAIDRLALANALSVLRRTPSIRLAINMSPLSMGDAEWLDILAEGARVDRSACARLILEVTEAAAMEDPGQTVDFMDHARRSGCAFALDDFGAGATSFRYFRDFRFDMVKIDGSFIAGIAAARDAQVLVECLMAVAKHFEMVTVAERVETAADAEWLRALGVDCLQGWLYGRPTARPEMPGEDDRSRIAG